MLRPARARWLPDRYRSAYDRIDAVVMAARGRHGGAPVLAVKHVLIALLVVALAAVAFLHEYHGEEHHAAGQVCTDPEAQRQAIVDMLLQHMRSH